MSKNVEVLGVEFENTTQKQMVDKIKERIRENRKTFIVTANPEIVMHAQRDPDYMETLRSADYIVPDGIGIIMGAKMLKTPLKERIAGFDLMSDLLAVANEERLNVFFLGSRENVLKRAVAHVNKNYPHVHISGYHHGYFQGNNPNVVQMVKEADPDLVFVALGFPRQEKWIRKNFGVFEKGIFMGVGGSFDVLAGAVKRAPALWRKLNLEWLYRFIRQPSRWRRMAVLPLFILKVASKRKRH